MGCMTGSAPGSKSGLRLVFCASVCSGALTLGGPIGAALGAQDDSARAIATYRDIGDLGFAASAEGAAPAPGSLVSKPYPGPWPLRPFSSEPQLQRGEQKAPERGVSAPPSPSTAPSIQTERFEVASSGGRQTVSGSIPAPTGATASRPEPSIGRPWYPPNDPVPSWVRELGPEVSARDYEAIQKLYIERAEIVSELRRNAPSNLIQLGFDLLGTLPGMPTSPEDVPLGEELLRQNQRVGTIDGELRQLFGRNHILADPAAADRPKRSSVEPSTKPNERYEVHVSDRTVDGIQPPDPSPTDPPKFDWTKGAERKFLESLGPAEFTSLAPPAGSIDGPVDPGGIDFRSLRWVYLSEASLKQPGSAAVSSISLGLQAVRASGGPTIQLSASAALASTAFFVLLAVPDEDIWVNLHPAEPNRITSPSLAQTEVGRIMLEADLQLKRDAGQLMRSEPYRTAEQQLVRSVAFRQIGMNPTNLTWGSTGRVEISSATGRVFAHETDSAVSIDGLILDVVYELKTIRISVGRSSVVSQSLTIPEAARDQFVEIIERLVRPELIRRVNQAPEYERLRQVFSARALVDWYKRHHRVSGTWAGVVDSRNLENLTSTGWSPDAIWRNYKSDYDSGGIRGFGGVTVSVRPTPS